MPLVVIEGVDGAGKSVQTVQLASRLQALGQKVECIHFPQMDRPVYGELIAAFLRGEFGEAKDTDPRLVALLYAGDRWAAADRITDLLKDGCWVLCDRYYASNLAYQGAKTLDPEAREKLIDWMLSMELDYFGIPEADATIFLDVPHRFSEEVLGQRAEDETRDYLRGQRDVHERDGDFQAKVRDIFMELGTRIPRYSILNCSTPEGDMRSVESIAEQVFDCIASMLP